MVYIGQFCLRTSDKLPEEKPKGRQHRSNEIPVPLVGTTVPLVGTAVERFQYRSLTQKIRKCL